jgi:hypothetical protein
MSLPCELRIIPTMTFRPLSPTLARLIENAHHELRNSALFYPVEEPTHPRQTDGSGTAFDRRA